MLAFKTPPFDPPISRQACVVQLTGGPELGSICQPPPPLFFGQKKNGFLPKFLEEMPLVSESVGSNAAPEQAFA